MHTKVRTQLLSSSKAFALVLLETLPRDCTAAQGSEALGPWQRAQARLSAEYSSSQHCTALLPSGVLRHCLQWDTNTKAGKTLTRMKMNVSKQRKKLMTVLNSEKVRLGCMYRGSHLVSQPSIGRGRGSWLSLSQRPAQATERKAVSKRSAII